MCENIPPGGRSERHAHIVGRRIRVNLRRERALGPTSGAEGGCTANPGKEFARHIAAPDTVTGTAISGPAPEFRAIAADYGIEFVD